MATSQFTTLISPDLQRPPVRILEQPVTWGFEPDLYRMLMVEPGSKIALGDINPNYSGEQQSYERTLPVIQSEVAKIDRLQYLMHSEGKHSLLIVLQSLDAGGKDGVVRHIVT